ncbi:MAG: hypothetical protein Q8N84_04145 [bacterium]|nr:hypothetical protein [bacterium]
MSQKVKRGFLLLVLIIFFLFLYSPIQIFRSDLDGDNNQEILFIWRGRAYLVKERRLVWQSDPEWKVERITFGDANNDGKPELLVSLWKFGSYGSSLPFWLKENTKEWGNHLFLYQWGEGKLKMVWGSSTLDEPIKEMLVGDFDTDGQNELRVLEKEKVGYWRWQGFNFFKES